MPRALIVDDDADTCATMAALVKREGFEVSTADCLDRARELACREHPDILLLDLRLPDGDGMEMVDALEAGELELATRPEIVLITGHASVDTAIGALRKGVVDYLLKPVDTKRLRVVLANVAKTRALRGQLEGLRRELRELGRFADLVGVSEPMQRVYDRVTRVAPTNATVLIVGESGTGKELVARAIHEASGRSAGPFRALNCGAVSDSLIESELFGHERGAFTGADRRHVGFFEQARHGTLFLDEIAEMPVSLQVKLLRVLETRTMTRVGGEDSVDIDVRLLAATNRELEEAIEEGDLREDLYYRLNVFNIELPPLRARGSDILLLAQHFVEALNRQESTGKRLRAATQELLTKYSWPGNVRELRNAIHSAFILADELIEPEMLPPEIRREGLYSGVRGDRLHVHVGMSIADAERKLILATLDDCGGNKSKAADVLGVSVKTLYNRLNAYEEEAAAAREGRGESTVAT